MGISLFHIYNTVCAVTLSSYGITFRSCYYGIENRTMCKVISISNQKGGVAKTVTSVNMGIGLAREGKKVLLIDADPQGSLTISMGYEYPDKMDVSLATIMMKVINDEPVSLRRDSVS